MGGISKAFYFGGLLIAHFFATRMYKAALMQDILMVQERGDNIDKIKSKQRVDDDVENFRKSRTTMYNTSA